MTEQKDFAFAVEMLKEWGDSGYLAGLIDGEGSFNVSQNSRNCWSARIDVTSSCLSVLEWIRKKYGGKLYSYKTREGREDHKSCWCWRISDKKGILGIIDRILPFLIIKQEQALLLREFYSEKKNRGRKVGEKEGERRMVIKQAIMAANQGNLQHLIQVD